MAERYQLKSDFTWLGEAVARVAYPSVTVEWEGLQWRPYSGKRGNWIAKLPDGRKRYAKWLGPKSTDKY